MFIAHSVPFLCRESALQQMNSELCSAIIQKDDDPETQLLLASK